MTTKLITRNRLKNLISAILNTFQVIAPVQGKNVSFFKQISIYEEIEWKDKNPVKSPKEYFFAPSTALFRFQMKGREILLEPVNSHTQRIVLGVRPCDAAALTVLDQVFFKDGMDILYSALRDNTLLIGQPCSEPGKDCFCASFGINPTDERSMDLMLTDIGEDQFLVKIVSSKGEDFFSYFSSFFHDPDLLSGYTPGPSREIASYIKQEKLFDSRIIKDWLDKNFEHPLWTQLATKCIGCGACTFFCPTCHCFDIADESVVYREGCYQGVRNRIWDSCSFGHFTRMPMHQPRPSQEGRFRQRIMHKFKYFVDRFQGLACVGCGRCRSLCPVGIDIVGVLQEIQELCSPSREVW